MKLKIKMLNQKSLVVDIEETKTVYELKKELSLYADIGVKPELQKLIYAGKILANDDKLSIYNIDAKKFLVIMILKQPLGEPPKAIEPDQNSLTQETTNIIEQDNEKSNTNNTSTTPSASSKPECDFKTPATPEGSKKDNLVLMIKGMGYPESDVRKALAASFYNAERAIEYLVDGIPTTPTTPESVSSATDADIEMTPFEIFRTGPMFQNFRKILRQNPELMDATVKKIGETNPALLDLICENQEEFLSMMLDDSSDDAEYEDDSTEDEAENN